MNQPARNNGPQAVFNADDLIYRAPPANDHPGQDKHAVGGGGRGGGSMEDVIRRVAALEKGQELIIGKLDGIAKGITDSRLENEKRFGAIEGRLTGIEAKLDTKAAKSDLTPIETKLTAVHAAIDTRAAHSELNLVKGKIESLPTTLQLILFAIAVFTAAGISRLFH